MNKEILKHIIRYILMIFIIGVCCTIFNFSAENGTQSSSTSQKVARAIVMLINKNLSESEFNTAISKEISTLFGLYVTWYACYAMCMHIQR